MNYGFAKAGSSPEGAEWNMSTQRRTAYRLGKWASETDRFLVTKNKGGLLKMKKDWNGNKNSVFKTLGASNHTDKEREVNDYYATEPKAMELLLEQEKFNNNVWECAVGEWHLANVLVEKGYKVRGSDILQRGNPKTEIIDFLTYKGEWDGDIITNPPYKYATEFIYKALDILPKGNKVAMFLKIQFLEGKARKKLFKQHPPKVIYVSSSRLLCAKNAEFDKMREGGGSAVAFAWFVWEKGYVGDTTIKWIN